MKVSQGRVNLSCISVDLEKDGKGEKNMSKGTEVWNSMAAHVCATRGQGGKRRQGTSKARLSILDFTVGDGKPLEVLEQRK